MQQTYLEKDQAETDTKVDETIGFSRSFQKNKQHLLIIELMKSNPMGLYQKEISENLKISESTVSRRISELKETNVIKSISEGKKTLLY